MKIVSPSPEGIQIAAQAIRQGKVVAFPAETVYGLAVDPFSEVALDALFQVKQRVPSQTVLLIVADEHAAAALAAEVPPGALQCMKAFWPGPLSILLPARSGLPSRIIRDGKICVRCPGNAVARRLCRVVDGPVTATSANKSGAEPVRDLARMDLPGIAVAIDDGILSGNSVSTIFDPSSGEILREGAIRPDEIFRVLGSASDY